MWERSGLVKYRCRKYQRGQTFKTYFILNYMCGGEYRRPQRSEREDSSCYFVIGRYEPSELHAGNWTWVLCVNHSTLNHGAISPDPSGRILLKSMKLSSPFLSYLSKGHPNCEKCVSHSNTSSCLRPSLDSVHHAKTITIYCYISMNSNCAEHGIQTRPNTTTPFHKMALGLPYTEPNFAC